MPFQAKFDRFDNETEKAISLFAESCDGTVSMGTRSKGGISSECSSVFEAVDLARELQEKRGQPCQVRISCEDGDSKFEQVFPVNEVYECYYVIQERLPESLKHPDLDVWCDSLDHGIYKTFSDAVQAAQEDLEKQHRDKKEGRSKVVYALRIVKRMNVEIKVFDDKR